MKHINIGIIGTGFGLTQVQAFNGLEHTTVKALCGSNLKKTQGLADQYGIKSAYSDYKNLLADETIDLVAIATPNHLHKPMFLDAIKANKHIILEKPAGLNSMEIQVMLEASKDYKKIVAVDHPMRFNPIILKLKELIKTDKLGNLTNIQISAYTNYVSDPNKEDIWIDFPEYGGGQILNMGTHLIDLTRYLQGLPKLRTGNLIKKTVVDKYPGGDNYEPKIEHQITANLDWSTGTNTSFFNTTTSFGYKNFEIKILGSKGIAFYDEAEGLRVSFSNDAPLQEVTILDPLKHIEAGRSFVSKSFKYFASNLVENLLADNQDFDYCTLDQAHENMKYLEVIQS